MVIQQLGPGIARQIQGRCPDCSGKGESFLDSDRCNQCNGQRVVHEDKTFEVHIDKGMKHGQKITFTGEGNQIPDCREAGDVVVVLVQKAHEFFERSENDLIIEHTVTLTEALCGFQFPIKHLDGRALVLKSAPGEVINVQANKTLKGDGKPVKSVKGEGMPIYRNPFEKGNLLVRFNVEYPTANLQLDQVKRIEELLGPKPAFTMPTGEYVEEVSWFEYDPEHEDQRRRMNDSDDEDSHGRGAGVQCQTQ